MKPTTEAFLQEKNLEIKNTVLDIFEIGKAGHIASSFSCSELMVTLFYGNILRYDAQNPKWDGRDRFVLSKGHAGILYYAILGDLGFFDKKELQNYAKPGNMFGVHVDITVPGVEVNTGSLAGGFGTAVGMAYAAKLDLKNHMVFVLIGDGECYEGSIWESAIFASGKHLNNLVVLLDHNHMCCSGFIEDNLSNEPFDKKWEAFGFDVIKINGHNFAEILDALSGIRCRKSNKPLCIIADTVKANGLDSVENTPLCHGFAPTSEAAIVQARKELNGRLKEWR